MPHRDLSDLELRALAFVDERELVRDLVELVSVPSVSGSDAECDVQHQLAKRSGEKVPRSVAKPSTTPSGSTTCTSPGRDGAAGRAEK